MELSNREIANLSWFLIFAILFLLPAKARQSFGEIIKAFFVPKILILLTIVLTYIVTSIFFLYKIGIWEYKNFKTSLVWGVTFAFVAIFDINRINGDKIYFRKTLRDIFKASSIVFFITEIYTFNLFEEIILSPILTILVLINAKSERQDNWKKIRTISGILLSLSGLFIIVYSIYHAIIDFYKLTKIENALEFGIPIILSLMFLPFIYCLSVYCAYENVITRIKYFLSDPKLQTYAKWQAILHFRIDLDFLRRWTRHIALLNINNKDGIKQSIRHIKNVKKREKNPPHVAKKDGWSPYIAKNFLIEFGLATDDYHFTCDNWYASSPSKELGDTIMPDMLAYYIEGNEIAVTHLKLKLSVNNPDMPSDSIELFFSAGKLLLLKSLGEHHVQNFSWDVGSQITKEGTHISLIRQNWIGGIKDGYSLMVTITKT